MQLASNWLAVEVTITEVNGIEHELTLHEFPRMQECCSDGIEGSVDRT
jgi:hypothetical protein